MAKHVASKMLIAALERHQIHLILVIAETGLWVHPQSHQSLISRTGSAAVYPSVRRARAAHREKRGQTIDGVRLDDNTYANLAIKRALGLARGEAEGYEACHIWPRTCYDPRYHTALANLVLLPRALAGFSDHDIEMQAAIQFRSYELYQWHPEGTSVPCKPAVYPDSWLLPERVHRNAGASQQVRRVRSLASRGLEMSREERDWVIRRVIGWAGKPSSNAHKIVALVANSPGGVPRQQRVSQVATIVHSRNAYGAVASMLTSNGNNYGRVFEEVNGLIHLHPAVAETVLSFTWRAG